jgi:hypothetical protein
VDLATLVDALARLDADDLRAVACAIDDHHRTVADEVAAWEDMMCIDDALRRSGRSHAAGRAAHDAVQAVRRAAASASVEIPDSVVVRIAREAAQLARALVAGDEAVAARDRLLGEWGSLARDAVA